MRHKPNYRGAVHNRQRWGQRWHADTFYANYDPYEHFSTLVQYSPEIAQAIQRWLLTQPSGPYQIFDLGSGSGALAQALRSVVGPEHAIHAVDMRPRPEHLPDSITWHNIDLRMTPLPKVDDSRRTLLIAHEFFDDIPCDVIDIGDDGIARWRESDDHGHPIPGSLCTDESALRWMERWWPPQRAGMSIEIGSTRDELWRSLMTTHPGTMGIVIDYGHTLRERIVGTWDAGTLVGYRNGHPVSPRLDGHTNVTAHVCMDSLAHQSPWSTLMRLSEFLDQPSNSTSTGSLGDFLVAITDMQGCE
jgi:SAM-dependent MidA family methyltransferase